MFLKGLGLFAARDLEKSTMIIEYIGELIRNEVANRREKLYESQVFKLFFKLNYKFTKIEKILNLLKGF